MFNRISTTLPLLLVTAVCCTAAQAGESYMTVGLPGVVAGYAYSVNKQLGLRADAGTTGSINKTGQHTGITFDGQAKYNRIGLFGDYFPFSGGFRITGGVTINRASLELKSRLDNTTSVTINGITVPVTPDDYFNVKVKFPTAMPYIGIGYGHDERQAGLGFVADIGVSFGRAKLSYDTNLIGRNGVTAADVDAKLDEVRDSVGHLTVLPSAGLGLSYRY